LTLSSGIQAGRWTKEPLRFIKDNLNTLSETKVALFVVCAYAADPDQCDLAQREFLDKIVVEYPGLAPISTGLFAGVLDFDKYNFAVKALVKSMVKKQLEPGEKIPEKIDFRNWNKIREWIANLVQ
jgi:menaquinone-dependent protoporphyrinogen IX oxidase